jgi:sortase A
MIRYSGGYSPVARRSKEKPIKKHWPTLILIVVFLIGFSILLYPIVSDYINSHHQSRAIANYDEGVSGLTVKDYSKYWQAADEYNQALAVDSDRFIITDEDEAAYNRMLNPTDNGIMGYIEIGTIGVKLPIYHGTGESILQVGTGHLEGSSLPAGGKSTHTILSGHRGLPSSKLFTDLDQLVIGDVFLLHILDRVLAYQVDQVLVVEPTDSDELAIAEGKDYCTLITCTPYGVNTHRLLVRGVRITYNEEVLRTIQVSADAMAIDSVRVASVLAVPMLFLLFIWLLISTGRKTPLRKKEGNK